MENITNLLEIEMMVNEKQQLEIMLAWELLEVFNNPRMGLIGELRKMVESSTQMMDKVAKGIPINQREELLCKRQSGYWNIILKKRKDDFKNLWKTEWSKKYFKFPELKTAKNQGGIKQPPHIKDVWDAGGILGDVKISFSAQHCADWIRVFGEVLEKVVKGDENAIRESWQKGDKAGGKYHWEKYDGRVKGQQLDKGRRRVMGEFHKKEVVMPDYAIQESVDKLHKHTAPAPPLTVWGFQRDITGAAGLKRWQVMQRDTTGKMDQVFGLMPGATISGTTTDNIDFLKRFGRMGMNPIFYMLPLATIVAGGHHSMVEVALPLMLNDLNNYRVGLYTTLFPTIKKTSSGAPSGVEVIKSKLKIAEQDNSNKLMLVYYNFGSSTPAGCYLYNTLKDKRAWERMRIGEGFMTAFKWLPPFPTQKEVDVLRGQLMI